MDTAFLQQYKDIVSLGLIDDRYPLEHTCVQLPNGWYGIDSILTGFQNVLAKYEYDEMLLPTVSSSAVFKDIPDEIKDNIDQRILTITHTGLHKLDDPYCLSLHPELITPQVEKFNARSYRDLPIRRALRYFRYVKPMIPQEVPLITDCEYPALDAEGIFATEEDYNSEANKVLSDFNKFLEQNLKLSFFTARTKYALIYYIILPDSNVLEIARMNYLGRILSEKIGFQVLESNNKFAPPLIFDLNITSRIFAGVVASHSVPHKVILPMHCMRTFGTSYGVDITKLNNKKVRVEVSRFPFTAERFQKLVEQGGVFALKPTENSNQVCIVTENGETVVEASQLEAKIVEIMEEREKKIAEHEKQLFNDLHDKAVHYISKDAPVPEGCTVLGTKENEPDVLVAAKTLLPQQ
ncbi:hypothetical protein M9Y10_022656 [Tritrichomonas musculus]|uniref:Uncharacterized protein n=1 Tax=Tritrichomonas musculus TaxID=1915356 RepID=A0ABR2KTF5_9EUKA